MARQKLGNFILQFFPLWSKEHMAAGWVIWSMSEKDLHLAWCCGGGLESHREPRIPAIPLGFGAWSELLSEVHRMGQEGPVVAMEIQISTTELENGFWPVANWLIN